MKNKKSPNDLLKVQLDVQYDDLQHMVINTWILDCILTNELKNHKKVSNGLPPRDSNVEVPMYVLSQILYFFVSTFKNNNLHWRNIPVIRDKDAEVNGGDGSTVEVNKSKQPEHKAIEFLQKNFSKFSTKAFASEFCDDRSVEFLTKYFRRIEEVTRLKTNARTESEIIDLILMIYAFVAKNDPKFNLYPISRSPKYIDLLVSFTYVWFFKNKRTKNDVEDQLHKKPTAMQKRLKRSVVMSGLNTADPKKVFKPIPIMK